MKYIVESNKTFVHDLQATLKNKGIDFQQSCKIFEICNPQKAYAVLQEDISLNMALPCRISVWTERGKTKIGMLSPKAILSMMSDSPALSDLAIAVEETTRRIIDQSK